MSASNKKQLRKEQEKEVLTAKQRQEQAEAKKLKNYTIGFIAVMVVVAIVAIGSLVFNGVTNSGIFERNTIAATVNGQDMNSIEMNYYYSDAISEMYQTAYEQYSSYYELYFEAMGLDLSKPLNEQTNPQTGETWSNFFVNSALENAKYDYTFSKLAEDNGFTLDEDAKASVETQIANLEYTAALYGYSSIETYLRLIYGTGADLESYETYLNRMALADAYVQNYTDSLTYDQAAMDEFAKDKVNDYNSYDYSYVYLSYASFMEKEAEEETATEETETSETVEATEPAETEAATEPAETEAATEPAETEAATEPAETEEATEPAETETEAEPVEDEAKKEAARAEAKKVAEELYALGNLDDIRDKIGAMEDTDLTVQDVENQLHTNGSKLLVDWLAAPERTEGEIGLLENASAAAEGEEPVINGYYVICFTKRNDNTAKMSNVRHLLVQYEGGTEDEISGEMNYTTEEMEAAKAEAEALLQQWKDGEATEESFSALVTEKTDDTASAESGGLYENIHAGSQYVSTFLAWSIDPARQVGDTGIVQTEYGYHIMYFSGYAEQSYRDQLITNEMKNADAQKWHDACMENATATTKDLSKVQLDLVIAG